MKAHLSCKKKIADFQADFRYKEGVISFSLKSSKKSLKLVANYAQDNMPTTLQNVINTPEQLFQVLQKMEDKDLHVSDKQELVMRMTMFSLIREYPLPLEKTDLSNQQKLANQIVMLQQEMAKLSNQLKEVEQSSIQKLDFSKKVIADLKTKLMQATKQNSALYQQIQALKFELERKGQNTVICSKDPIEDKKKVEELQKELNKMGSMVKQKTVECKILKQKVEERTMALEHTHMCNQKLTNQYEQKIKVIEEKYIYLKKQNEQMKKSIADGTAMAQVNKNDIMSEQVQKLKLEIQDLQCALDESKMIEAELKQQVYAYKQQLMQLKMENKALCSQIQQGNKLPKKMMKDLSMQCDL